MIYYGRLRGGCYDQKPPITGKMRAVRSNSTHPHHCQLPFWVSFSGRRQYIHKHQISQMELRKQLCRYPQCTPLYPNPTISYIQQARSTCNRFCPLKHNLNFVLLSTDRTRKRCQIRPHSDTPFSKEHNDKGTSWPRVTPMPLSHSQRCLNRLHQFYRHVNLQK